MSTASDALAARMRPMLSAKPHIEKRIIGGIGFMLNGNMAVGTTSKGDLLVRIDPQQEAAALSRPGAYVMHMGKMKMTGFIAVAADTLDAASLADWIAYSLAYAETLPPK